MMAVRALVGRELTWAEAEELSGFVPGHYTWPYGMFLALANMGLAVTSIEDLDPHDMVARPEHVIAERYADTGKVREILADFDIEAERTSVKRCLEEPSVRFEVRVPRVEDLGMLLEIQQLPLVSLDFGILNATGSYEGHMVVVSGFDGERVEIYDPGPPAEGPRVVPSDKFREAMLSGSGSRGAVIGIAASNPGN